MDEPHDLEGCFKRGARARRDGLGMAENPYDVKTPEYREWAAGWSATFDLDEDDDPVSTRIKSGCLDNGDEPGDDADTSPRQRRPPIA